MTGRKIRKNTKVRRKLSHKKIHHAIIFDYSSLFSMTDEKSYNKMKISWMFLGFLVMIDFMFFVKWNFSFEFEKL